MFKNGNIKFVLFPILVVVLLAVILIAVFTKGHPKTPATAEKVFNAIESNGFVGADITSDYQEKLGMGTNFKKQSRLKLAI